jgi:hypothetical protein
MTGARHTAAAAPKRETSHSGLYLVVASVMAFFFKQRRTPDVVILPRKLVNGRCERCVNSAIFRTRIVRQCLSGCAKNFGTDPSPGGEENFRINQRRDENGWCDPPVCSTSSYKIFYCFDSIPQLNKQRGCCSFLGTKIMPTCIDLVHFLHNCTCACLNMFYIDPAHYFMVT